MKVTCSRKVLLDGLRAVTPAAGKGNSMAVLQCVLLEAIERGLRLTATDLEVTVERRVSASVTEAGSVAVPARLLSDLVGALVGDEVTLELNTKQDLEVRCGQFNSRVKTIPADEFPATKTNGIMLGQAALTVETFKQMVAQAGLAAALDTSRPILTGVLLRCQGDKLTMVGADGYRLSVRWEDLEGDARDVVDMIVPRSALDLAARNADDGQMVVISQVADRGQVVIDLGRTTVRSQLVEGRFPDYTQLVPTTTGTRVKIEREALEKACKVGLLFSKEAARIVKLAVTQDGVTVVGECSETGDSTTMLPATVEGDSMGIAFDGSYLAQALGAMETEQVTLGITDANSPGLLEPDGETFKHVIMPMHLNR